MKKSKNENNEELVLVSVASFFVFVFNVGFQVNLVSLESWDKPYYLICIYLLFLPDIAISGYLLSVIVRYRKKLKEGDEKLIYTTILILMNFYSAFSMFVNIFLIEL